MARKLNYNARNFSDIRTELVEFVRKYYPEVFSDYNDASVGMMLLELNAAVGDVLSFNTDRMFQETQIDFAQERKNLLSMARTMGLKIPGKRPSISLVEFSVVVPVLGDTFDISYAPVIRKGAQVTGGGKVFETTDDIDFSSPFTTGGIPNRKIIPNFNSNNTLINYTLTKREVVLNGSTKIYKRVINSADVRPFFELVLPDNDVLSIESVILLEGTNYNTNPSLDEFLDEDKRWYEVDALAENKIFVEDTNRNSDNLGIIPGKFIRITKKFLHEYTDRGFSKLIFGGGTQDVSSLNNFDTDSSLLIKIGDFINNLSLGETLTANRTLFIQYRVGGGSDTNLGPNTLTSTGIVDMFVNGINPTINRDVQSSLTVNNLIPALGGRDEPSVEEVRNLVRYNFSSQNRAVTLKDYEARIGLMPGEFGVPFRVGVSEEQNKIVVSVLGLNSDGSLTNTSTSTLRNNITDYLADFRMINDYVEVRNGKIYNLGIDVDIFVDNQFPKSQIITEGINKVENYFDINNKLMGENIYLSDLIEMINNIPGVLNVIDLKIYNFIGDGVYSLNEISQPLADEETREIDLLGQFTIFGEPNAMFEIKQSRRDVRFRIKTN